MCKKTQAKEYTVLSEEVTEGTIQKINFEHVLKGEQVFTGKKGIPGRGKSGKRETLAFWATTRSFFFDKQECIASREDDLLIKALPIV